MKDTDFLALSTHVRILENRLLTKTRRERMIDAAGDEEVAKLLSECGYAEPEELTAECVNATLTRARTELFRELKKEVPVPALIEVFQIKYDYHNAKALIKSDAIGEDARRLLMEGGRYAPEQLANDFHKGELENCSEAFREATERATAVLSETRDPQRADLILDRACYEEMTAAAKESKSRFLQGYVRLCIDSVNLRLTVRCRRTGVSEGLLSDSLLPNGSVPTEGFLSVGENDLAKLLADTPLRDAAKLGDTLTAPDSGSLSPLERACDNALTRYLSDAKRIPFGEQPIVAYLCAREAEAVAIRTILAGRKAGESGETIRERLRECYV